MKIKVEIEILRIIACFLVIMSHLVCLVVFDTNYTQWDKANILYIARNACVPLFLAISGILILKKEIRYKKMISNSLKFGTLYILFVFLYELYKEYNMGTFTGFDINSLKSVALNGFLNPQGHLWYLPLIIQIYLIMPILKQVVSNKLAIRVYIVIWTFASLVKPLILEVLNFNVDSLSVNIYNVINKCIDLFPFSELYTYSGYLILGYYLYYEFERKVKAIYLAGIYILSVIIAAGINKYCLNAHGSTFGNAWEYLSLIACIETICLILIAKDTLSKINWSNRQSKVINIMSSSTFGIYIIHALLTEKAYPYFVTRNLYVTIPFFAVIIFVSCCIVVFIYKKMVELFLIKIFKTNV